MKRFLRLGLMTRVILALVLVGLVPLAVVLTDRTFVEKSLRKQVLQTHALVAGSRARDVAAFVANHRILAEALAKNPAVYGAPTSPAAEELLAGMLQSQPNLAAVSLTNIDGEEFLRAQRKDFAAEADQVLATVSDQELAVFQLSSGAWIRVDVPFADGSGVVREVVSSKELNDILRPDEIGPIKSREKLEEVGAEADLVLASREGEVILGTLENLDNLPPTLVTNALSGQISGVAGDDAEILGAFAPVPRSSWVVISVQPKDVAEFVAVRMRKSFRWALGGALGLTTLLTFGAYGSVVRPIRSLVRSQQRLAGLSPQPQAGNEIEQLQESFSVLERRLQDQKALGKVFLGRYQVIEVIGEGGMGTVFRGWDPKLQRPVALKTIRLVKASSEEQRQDQVSTLLHEAVAAARITHPNVVAVYDVLDQGNVAFMSMELVDGITLSDYLLTRGRIEPRLLVSLAISVARGLGAAHKEGIVHHDIKPGNVLLGWSGEVKVVDFGIARFISSLQERSDTVFGTPGYLPPEALRGEPYTEAGDLFSLGVVMYESLCGRRPFAAGTMREIVLKTLRDEAAPLTSRDPNISPDLEAIVMSLLRKDPEDRISTADQLLSRLGGLPNIPWVLEGYEKKDDSKKSDSPHSRLCTVVGDGRLPRSA
ncbi:MAG: serine/threonine protein kinase [Deltaproteobacteria bacterium]|nr:serine/threonine protein kinase [Deltaproteobacteria bacterium]